MDAVICITTVTLHSQTVCGTAALVVQFYHRQSPTMHGVLHLLIYALAVACSNSIPESTQDHDAHEQICHLKLLPICVTALITLSAKSAR
jgi:hypothetical protein